MTYINNDGLTPRRFFNLAQVLAYNLRKRYLELEKSGRALMGQMNQFGESSVIADWELEETVIKFWQATGFKIGWVTEEHGSFNLKGAEYVAYLDGLDGSRVYVEGEGGRCGTMLGMYLAGKPDFSGYLGSLLVDYGQRETGGDNTLIAAAGLGAWVDDTAEQGKYIKVQVDNSPKPHKKLIAYADLYFAPVRQAATHLPKVKFIYLKASLPYYVDLVEGYSWLVLECTRKHSLEIAAAYPLVHEAGGVMVDVNSGKELGKLDRSIANTHGRLIVSTTNLDIATKLRDKLESLTIKR